MASWDAAIVNRRLRSLHRELTGSMKIRITEPVYFLGKKRRAGEILDNVATGPFRKQAIAGGLNLIPQFVKMTDEIKQDTTQSAPPPLPDAPKTVPPATVLNLPPLVAALPAKGNALAARVRALTARRAKFADKAAAILGDGEAAMAKIESEGPAILERSVQASQDELTAITDLADSLKELDRVNNIPN